MRRISISQAGLCGAAVALCAGAYLVPYVYLGGTWWRFIPSTIVIVVVGMFAGRRDALKLFGLRMTRRAVVLGVALFAAILPVSHYVLTNFLAGFLEVQRTIVPQGQLAQFFQVLNDEILMRAAVLTFLLRVFPHPKPAIVALAAVFAGGHGLVYGLDGIGIDPLAIATLFAFGVVGNTLFVRFRHIAYPLALHYGWNFFRFNTRYYLHGRLLPEGETFNYIEGNPSIVGGSWVLMFIVWVAYINWARRSSIEPGASRERPQ